MPSSTLPNLTNLATPQPTMLLYAALSPFGATDDRKITANALLAEITASISDLSVQWADGDGTATVSAAGTGKIRYNDTSKTFQASLDGAAYVDFNTGGGGGGDSTFQGTWAGRPAASNNGDLYFSTDGFVISRDLGAGNGYSQWTPMFSVTPAIDGDYTWINQGGATITDTGGALVLAAPANAGDSWRIRKKSAPATPYTITIAFLTSAIGANFCNLGFVWRQSSDGKLVTAQIGFDGVWRMGVVKWDNATTFNNNYVTAPAFPHSAVTWIQISDDGADRIVRISGDGQHWIEFHSVGNTDFLTADEVGFAVDANNANFAATMSLLHWIES